MKVEKIFELLGGDLTNIECMAKLCNDYIESEKCSLEIKKIKKKLLKIFKNNEAHIDAINNISDYRKEYQRSGYNVYVLRTYKIYDFEIKTEYDGSNEGDGTFGVHIDNLVIDEECSELCTENLIKNITKSDLKLLNKKCKKNKTTVEVIFDILCAIPE